MDAAHNNWVWERIARLYDHNHHPFQIFERAISEQLSPSASLLDIGCGREAPILQKFAGQAGTCIGVDPIVEPVETANVRLLRGTADNIALPSSSVDVVYSRSVLEHLEHPLPVFREIRRVLRPGGRFIALTPNRWDYASVAASLIPNRMHPGIVRRIEGRAEQDTFPTFYRANSARALRSIASQSGFAVGSIEYLNQYPAYLAFSRVTFHLGVAYERLTSRYEALRGLRGWIFAVLRAA